MFCTTDGELNESILYNMYLQTETCIDYGLSAHHTVCTRNWIDCACVYQGLNELEFWVT